MDEYCEYMVAEFVYGPVLCGNPATHAVDCGYGCLHPICDEHYKMIEGANNDHTQV